MEKEEIFARTKNLPEIEMGNIAKDHQIWEGNELGANFKITKEFLSTPIGKLPAVYALSVSGDEDGKVRLIADFENAFGRPISRNSVPILPGIEFVLWKAANVDRQRAK